MSGPSLKNVMVDRVEMLQFALERTGTTSELAVNKTSGNSVCLMFRGCELCILIPDF